MAEALSISFRQGDGSIEHNNREFIAENVDSARTPDNIIYVKKDLREMYHELFDAALEKYNSEQTRKSRKIPDYYEHIKKGKKEKLFQEVIVTFGNSDVCTLGSENWNKAIELLDDYARNFEKRNPQLKIANMVMHLDEACPHLHIDFVPVCYGQEQGLETRVSMKRAIQQMLGITGTSQKQTEAIIWGNAEREEMEKILKVHNMKRQVVGAMHDHKSLKEYREYAQKIKSANEHVKALIAENPADLTSEDVTAIVNQNNYLRGVVTDQAKEIAELRVRSTAKFIPFDVYNDERRQYIIESLTVSRIPYFEESSKIFLPECWESTVKKIADSYKPVKNTTKRDELRFAIDRLIYMSSDFEDLLKRLEQNGCEVRRGKYTAVKPPYAQRFMRLKTLGEQYTEYAIADRIKNKDSLKNEIAKSESYANDMEKTIYSVQIQTMELVSAQRITPVKSRSDEPYSFLNDKTIDALSSVLATLAEFNISSRDRLYKVSNDLQEKIDNCDDADELFELKSQLARVEVAVRTYEEIVEGNYIDNRIRAERERKATEKPNVALGEKAEQKEEKAAPEKPQEPKHTQTTNKKRGRR